MAAKSSEWRPGPTVCRCCLTEGCYKDISTEYFWMGKREVYAEMLKDTLEITISYSKAGGPNSNSRLICEPCISRLRDATEFKRQVVECERMFMQHLDPGSTSQEIEVEAAPLEKIKVEGVKLENSHSDDDFGDHHFGDDDDDDDLDNQPLTKLASKTPKKESVDFMDLLDNSKAAEKRKSTSKAKPPPPKKTKTKVEPSTKPSSSKAKPEKKKKGDPPNNVMHLTRLLGNEIVVKKLPKTNTTRMENPVAVRKELLLKPEDVSTKLLVNSKEVTIRKAPMTNSSTTKKAFLVLPKRKIILKKSSANKMPIASETILPKKKRRVISCITVLKSTTVCPFKRKRGWFRCLYCDDDFLNICELEEHAKQHESFSEDDIYRILLRQQIHDPIKLNVKEFGCKICGDFKEDWSALKQHLAEKHELQIDPENDCVVLYKMNKHNYDCALCDKKFGNYKVLGRHVTEHYNKFFCDQCGKIFITATSLKNHMITHENGAYPCTACGKVFKNLRGRYVHYKTVHTKTSISFCNICHKGFKDHGQKLRHMKHIHNADLPEYKCSFCSKVFISNAKCNTHMKHTHLKATCYKCDMCDYKHHIKTRLVSHMLVHTGVKSYKCNVCGKAYGRSFTLREHMRIHNDDRRFKCNYCDRAFVQKCSLKGHMKTHHKDVVFD